MEAKTKYDHRLVCTHIGDSEKPTTISMPGAFYFRCEIRARHEGYRSMTAAVAEIARALDCNCPGNKSARVRALLAARFNVPLPARKPHARAPYLA